MASCAYNSDPSEKIERGLLKGRMVLRPKLGERTRLLPGQAYPAAPTRVMMREFYGVETLQKFRDCATEGIGKTLALDGELSRIRRETVKSEVILRSPSL